MRFFLRAPVLGRTFFGSGLKATLSLSLAFLVAGAAVPSAHAQTNKEQMHAQNHDEAQPQVQVYGGDPSYDGKSFEEKFATHPEDITTFGHVFDHTFHKISEEDSFFFAIIALTLIVCMVFFRYDPKKRAAYFDGSSKKIVLTSVGAAVGIFCVLDVPLIFSSYKDTHEVIWNYPSGPDVIKIMAQPQQWAWNFKYAGNDGVFNTDDDIDTLNDLRVPKGAKVLMQLKSRDVIHGFMVANFRYQIDVLPGHVTKFWFDTTRTGAFEVACYQLCGTAHYKMKAFLTVLEPEDYAAWIKENSEWAKAKYDGEDKQVHWGWNWGTEEGGGTGDPKTAVGVPPNDSPVPQAKLIPIDPAKVAQSGAPSGAQAQR